jgi:hypothetical protein
MRPLFPDGTIEHNKKPSFRWGGVLRFYRRTIKFALQTHRDFGSLALWESC